MDRRAFVAGAVSVLAGPPGAEAQPQGKVYRIGFLSGSVPNPLFPVPLLNALRDLGLARVGQLVGLTIPPAVLARADEVNR